MKASSNFNEAINTTVVIPNWNGMKWLPSCLEALFCQDLAAFHVIIVDNASADASKDYIKKHFPLIELIELDSNTGFAHAVNIGIAAATSDYIALLNTDTLVSKNWLSTLVNKMDESPSNIAAINPLILNMSDSNLVDDAGDELSWYLNATKRGNTKNSTLYQETEKVFSPSGCASLYRRSFLNELEGFDASFFAYLEDVDLGFRGQLLGYQYIYLPSATLLHKSHGSSIAPDLYIKLITRNRLLMLVKNVPFNLLIKNSWKIIYGQIYFFLVYGKPFVSLKGYLSFLRLLPQCLKKRKKMMPNIKISNDELNNLLHNEKPDPTISYFFGRYVLFFKRKLGFAQNNY